MLVYGDHTREVHPSEVLAGLRERLRQVDAMPPGIRRHAALVTLLIEAGELVAIISAIVRNTKRNAEAKRNAETKMKRSKKVTNS